MTFTVVTLSRKYSERSETHPTEEEKGKEEEKQTGMSDKLREFSGVPPGARRTILFFFPEDISKCN